MNIYGNSYRKDRPAVCEHSYERGFKALSRGGRPYFWPVSLCGSGDYEKCVPHLGSTWVREVSEKEGVTGQQRYEKVGLRCRDTGKSAEKGVSRMDKGLGGRRRTEQKEPRRRTSKRNQGKRAQKRNQEKEKPPASIEGNLILAGGKILRLRSE